MLVVAFPSIAIAEEVPMWAGKTKTQKMIQADKQFIASVEKISSKREAAIRANQLGWKFLSQKKPDLAIKRFNQAWLLDATNANIYWGFAIAVHQQGKPTKEVMKYFRKAELGFSKVEKALVDLYADQGQVLGERKLYMDSISAFEKALKLNPKHKKSQRGILVSAFSRGDK